MAILNTLHPILYRGALGLVIRADFKFLPVHLTIRLRSMDSAVTKILV